MQRLDFSRFSKLIRPPADDELGVEDLLRLQVADDTSRVLALIAKAEDYRDRLIAGNVGPHGVAAAQARIDHQRSMLRRSEQRDRVQAGRPDGCWCLGAGGKDPVIIGLPARPGSAPPTVYREHCGCAEGLRAQAEAANTRRGATQSWVIASAGREFGGIPELYRDLSWDTYPVTESTRAAFQAIRSHDMASGAWLTIYGDVGTGKTALALLLVGQAMDAGRSAIYYTLVELLDRMRASFDRRQSGTADVSEQTLLTAALETDVLMLDDIGAESNRAGGLSAWGQERLFRIIDHRYKHRRQTVVTSNLDLSALAVHVGDRTVSRLSDPRIGRIVRLSGPDLRRPGLDRAGTTPARLSARDDLQRELVF